jgi:hypothetical protein
MRRVYISGLALAATAWFAAPAAAQYMPTHAPRPDPADDTARLLALPSQRWDTGLTPGTYWQTRPRWETGVSPATYWQTRTAASRFWGNDSLNRVEFHAYHNYFERNDRAAANRFWSSYDYWFGPRTRIWQPR